MDWFTLFGVPFARPPQRVPLGGLGGIAGPQEMGAVSELGVAGAAEAKSGRHWTLDVITAISPLFRRYFSRGEADLPTISHFSQGKVRRTGPRVDRGVNQ